MAKLIPLLIAALLAAPARNPARPQDLPSPAEFPPQDSALWLLVSEGLRG